MRAVPRSVSLSEGRPIASTSGRPAPPQSALVLDFRAIQTTQQKLSRTPVRLNAPVPLHAAAPWAKCTLSGHAALPLSPLRLGDRVWRTQAYQDGSGGNHDARADLPQQADGANLAPGALLALVLAVLPSLPAGAQDAGVAYDPSGGSGAITSFTGVAYLALVAFFLFRLFQRRAKRFTTERINSGGAVGAAAAAEDSDSDEEEEEVAEQPGRKTGPVKALVGTLQFAGLTAALWLLATSMEASLVGMELPDAYTARNITSTLRTAAIGTAYLATFVFAANTLGLAALTLKLLVYGDDDAPVARKPSESLPRLRVTDDVEDVRAAFAQIEREAAIREAKAKLAKEGGKAGGSRKRQ